VNIIKPVLLLVFIILLVHWDLFRHSFKSFFISKLALRPDTWYVWVSLSKLKWEVSHRNSEETDS